MKKVGDNGRVSEMIEAIATHILHDVKVLCRERKREKSEKERRRGVTYECVVMSVGIAIPMICDPIHFIFISSHPILSDCHHNSEERQLNPVIPR